MSRTSGLPSIGSLRSMINGRSPRDGEVATPDASEIEDKHVILSLEVSPVRNAQNRASFFNSFTGNQGGPVRRQLLYAF